MPSASSTGTAKAAEVKRGLSHPKNCAKFMPTWRARELSFGRTNLSLCEPFVARTAAVEAHQASPTRTLGPQRRD